MFVIVVFVLYQFMSRCRCASKVDSFSVSSQNNNDIIIDKYGGMVPPEYKCGLIDRHNVTCNGDIYNYNNDCDVDGENCNIIDGKLVCKKDIICEKNGKQIIYSRDKCGVMNDVEINCSGSYNYKCMNDFSFRSVKDWNGSETYGCYFDPDKYTEQMDLKYYYDDYNIDDNTFPGIQILEPVDKSKRKVYCTTSNTADIQKIKFSNFKGCSEIPHSLESKYDGIYCNNLKDPSKINCSNQKMARSLLSNFDITSPYINDEGEDMSLSFNFQNEVHHDTFYSNLISAGGYEDRLVSGGGGKLSCNLTHPIDKNTYNNFKTELKKNNPKTNYKKYIPKPYWMCSDDSDWEYDYTPEIIPSYNQGFSRDSAGYCDVCSCSELCINTYESITTCKKTNKGAKCPRSGCCDDAIKPAPTPTQSTCQYGPNDKNGYTQWFDIDPEGHGSCKCPENSTTEYDMADGPNQPATKYRCKTTPERCEGLKDIDFCTKNSGFCKQNPQIKNKVELFFPINGQFCCNAENYGHDPVGKVCDKGRVCCKNSVDIIDTEVSCCPQKYKDSYNYETEKTTKVKIDSCGDFYGCA
jgi:hypothetical protein